MRIKTKLDGSRLPSLSTALRARGFDVVSSDGELLIIGFPSRVWISTNLTVALVKSVKLFTRGEKIWLELRLNQYVVGMHLLCLLGVFFVSYQDNGIIAQYPLQIAVPLLLMILVVGWTLVSTIRKAVTTAVQ